MLWIAINGAVGPLLDHADGGEVHIVEVHDLRREENVLVGVRIGVMTWESEWKCDRWMYGSVSRLRWHVDVIWTEGVEMRKIDV